MKYRKKPVVIDAIQLTKEVHTEENMAELRNFMAGSRAVLRLPDGLEITTLEGNMKANINDWIIKGVKGECYPCKPDIFEQTYEKVA
jgi:hypothetical protein